MKGTKHHKHSRDSDLLEELFKHATVREKLPSADEEAIRAALHAQWSEANSSRRQRRMIFSLAAAASAILAVLLVTTFSAGPKLPGPATQIATTEKVMGMVFLKPADGAAASRLGAADVLENGQGLSTRQGSRLALRWLNGASVRLDQNSNFQITADGKISLKFGRIYVDTQGVSPGSSTLIIVTPAGEVQHLGTQYMTAVAGDTTTVSVREGRVVLSSIDKDVTASRGEQLTVDSSGAERLKAIPGYGDLWRWAEEISPVWTSDGHSIADFLDWVARETGRKVLFASSEAESLAADIELRGDMDMEPMRALTFILQTSDLVPEITDGTITVRVHSEP